MIKDCSKYSVTLFDDDNSMYILTCNDMAFISKIESVLTEFFNAYEGEIEIDEYI